MAYVVSARWLAHEGREERVAELIGELGAVSRAEPGCVTWLPHRSITEPRLRRISATSSADRSSRSQLFVATTHFCDRNGAIRRRERRNASRTRLPPSRPLKFKGAAADAGRGGSRS